RARLYEPVDDMDLDTHRGETAEMHVEWATADVVAAGHRNTRLTETAYEWPEHVHGGAHQGNQLVGSHGPQRPGGVDLQLVWPRPRDPGPHAPEYVDHH